MSSGETSFLFLGNIIPNSLYMNVQECPLVMLATYFSDAQIMRAAPHFMQQIMVLYLSTFQTCHCRQCYSHFMCSQKEIPVLFNSHVCCVNEWSHPQLTPSTCSSSTNSKIVRLLQTYQFCNNQLIIAILQ